MGKNKYIITIGIIISALAILLLVILYFWGIDDGAKLGGAIAGTIGVGATAFGTYYIVMNFWEQKKINEKAEDYRLKSEVDRLGELFYAQIEAFFTLFDKSNNCVGSEYKSPDEYLRCKFNINLFEKIKTDPNVLSSIAEPNKYDDITSELKNFAEDLDLTRISLNLNRILLLKNTIESLRSKNSELISTNVNEIWQSIPTQYKEFAGFYLSWNGSKDKNYENELVVLFLDGCYREMKNEDIKILPDYIPSIILKNDSLAFDECFQFSLTNCSPKDVEIKNIKVSYEDEEKLDIPANLTIAKHMKIPITIPSPEFATYIKGAKPNENETKELNIDVYIEYRKSIWKIERKMNLTNKEPQRK